MDPGCAGTTPCIATNETSCDNGLDDDDDGHADCADFDCLLDFTQSACDLGLAVHDLQDATDNDTFTGTRGDTINDPVQLTGVVVTFVDPTNSRRLRVADQSATDVYTAMLVYVTATAGDPSTLAPGDVINLAGLLTEFVGETEIMAYALEDTGADATVPAAANATVADLIQTLPEAERTNDRFVQSPSTGLVTDPDDDLLTAERYEGMLVTLSDLVVRDVHVDTDGLTIITYEVGPNPDTAPAPRFLVGLQFASPADVLGIGQEIDSVTGIITYHRRTAGTEFVREYRLQPRSAADWVYTVVIDSDGDGLPDAVEALFGTDPDDPDTDKDFWADGEEVLNPGDPADAVNDIDGDGIIDALECFLLDRDGDNVSDELDAANYDGPGDDRDLDGIPNSEDLDDDGDGVADDEDNCPYAPEAPAAWMTPQQNLDALVGDADFWSFSPGDLYDGSSSGNACDWDPDGDFWMGLWDNCPYTYNWDQLDSDGNGVGDACERTAYTPFPCDVDTDGSDYSCEIIIEEVLYRLSTTALPIVDANRDSVRDIVQDEFVELRSVSDYVLDLSGLELWDEMMPRHVFPAGTILRPNQRVVVFGGGTPTLFSTRTVVQTASTGSLGLNNAGDTVLLVDPSASTIITELELGYIGTPSSGYNVSVTRYPDGTGVWMPHPERTDPATGTVWKISPGTAPDNGRP